LKKSLAIFVMVILLGACAGKQPMMARQVSDEVNRINMELPRKINYNTTLERVTFDQVHSILVCHFTVYRWERDNLVAHKQSKHLFCEMMEQKYRDHLFSMVDTIEYEYKTIDGRMQFAFVADKTTCN
jgi:predicted methyltransferase